MASLLSLPADLHLCILKFVPDIKTLKTAVIRNNVLYSSFAAYKCSVATAVLKNELGLDIYPHAIINHLAAKEDVFRNNSSRIKNSERWVPLIHEYWNQMDTMLLTPMDTATIATAHHKVKDICDIMLGGRSNIAVVYPLYNSDRFLNPSPSERLRVQRGVYLFHITISACAFLCVQGNSDLDSMADILQRTVLEPLLAPWELNQISGIQTFLQRSFIRTLRKWARHSSKTFDTEQAGDMISLQTIRSVIGSGLDNIHRILCVADGHGNDHDAIPGQSSMAGGCGHIFDLGVGRAVQASNIRAWSSCYDDYKSLCHDDAPAFRAWRRLRERRMEFLDNSPFWSTALQPELSILGEHFGFWGIPFWDDDRWDDVIHAVAQSHLDHLLHLTYELEHHTLETLVLEHILAPELI
ncbi:hypothetical protein Purlil1_13711 [Purpureocillium lilacinum]|uniref:F-box domain-containing protein n=1 Tax=Purpureocillium lilacinum TaxID=33203 RepID=A0ABR0BDB2_PURLI|nr:hypothetical protein Purlil1_13711 [Purpureocillium lilacinum]